MKTDMTPCISCGVGQPEGVPVMEDVSGILCAECSPRVSDLLTQNDGGFVDLSTGEPLSPRERRAWYDACIARGAKRTDSLARFPEPRP